MSPQPNTSIRIDPDVWAFSLTIVAGLPDLKSIIEVLDCYLGMSRKAIPCRAPFLLLAI